MKRLIARLVIVVLLVATVFAVAPQASAQDGTPSVLWANIGWFTSCGSGIDGEVIIDFAVTVFPGYSVTYSYGYTSPTYGSGSFTYTFVELTGVNFVRSDGFAVPFDGRTTAQYDVYAPNGVLLSSTMFFGDCATGKVWTSYGDVYGINEPAASARVMGNVLVDTPVYSEPSLTAALKPVLKAGQTWFIVGQTTGTDGALWYKVFVGGKNMGYVPASTMAPQGPVPGAK
ncbi:MAG TPA: hypothetical protein VHP83_25350 [Aggregatilineaceae bacterium]|nr:hypothetical protein [Aggregatilineaceae bacterium]